MKGIAGVAAICRTNALRTDVTDGALTASGTLTVLDTDAHEALFVVQAATEGSHGTFTLLTASFSRRSRL